MATESNVGLGTYQGGGAKSVPRQVFAKLIEKTSLRAALAAVQADIDASLPMLNANELQELQGLMSSEISAVDAETESMRAQVAEEAELAQTTRAMQVQIPRRASTILASEVERRIARGSYPSAESLVGEAVAKAFAGGAPMRLCSVAGCGMASPSQGENQPLA